MNLIWPILYHRASFFQSYETDLNRPASQVERSSLLLILLLKMWPLEYHTHNPAIIYLSKCMTRNNFSELFSVLTKIVPYSTTVSLLLSNLSRDMTKPAMWLCVQRWLRSERIDGIWPLFLHQILWEIWAASWQNQQNDCAQQRLRSAWASARVFAVRSMVG